MIDFELTPEEQEAVANATPEDWANAAAIAARDPEFWARVGNAFLMGFLQGIARGVHR